MKKKIAIIDSVAARGGSHHYYLFGQSIGLLYHNVEVNLFINNITEDPNIKELKVYRYYKGIFGRKSKIISGFLYVVGSIRSIFHAKYLGCNICHYHLFHINILTVFDLILTRSLRMKAVYTIHDVVSNLEKSQSSKTLANFVLKFANRIFTHNQFSKNQVQELFKQANNIRIIPHGNYIPFIEIEENQEFSRTHLDIPKEKKVLLFFGMIKRIKGLEIILESLAKVKNKDIVLVIAGKVWEGDFSKYQEIIDKNKLNKQCIIRNQYIPSEDVNYYFSAADLVVLPYKRISQSGVLMMAVSYQRPVLCSALDPFKEVINDNETGFLFEVKNPDSLAEKITTIFNDEDLLRKVSDSGFNLIKTRYNWESIGKLLKNAYKTI